MTSRSSDAERLDRAFRVAIDAARSDKSIGAGQRATAVHGLEILQFEARLGVPLYPDEPVSQVIAHLTSEYAFRTFLIGLWQPENHPYAEERLMFHGEARSEILEYLAELEHQEIPGAYTGATTVEQLEQRLAAPVATTGRIDYAALKERIDIVEYISRHVQLKKAGNTYKGKCPFHAEKTASFTVYPNTKSYYCFGCMAAGDVIDFARGVQSPLVAA